MKKKNPYPLIALLLVFGGLAFFMNGGARALGINAEAPPENAPQAPPKKEDLAQDMRNSIKQTTSQAEKDPGPQEPSVPQQPTVQIKRSSVPKFDPKNLSTSTQWYRSEAAVSKLKPK